jgi:hypothetical protein
MKPTLLFFTRFCGLAVAHLVLFLLGATLFAPKVGDPEPSGTFPGGLFAVALLDSALMLWFLAASHLRGARLLLSAASVFWGVKSFTSALEAVYFMPNVGLRMLPGLLLMTIPLAVGLPAVGMLLLSKWKGDGNVIPRKFELEPGSLLAIFGLSAVVYPLLFFLAGWFIAFASPEVVAFYGGTKGSSFVSHMTSVLRSTPTLYLFEVFRGALWVAFAVPLLLAVPGPWWLGTLHVALWFSVIQNDVHLLPNPLMPPGVRMTHLLETASSNFVWAFAIGYALRRYVTTIATPSS